MKFPFFRKTSGWRVPSTERSGSGAIFVTTVFMLLAFTTLALGMVVLSQVYLKVAGLRKSSCQMEYASENGIKSGFHHLRKAIDAVPAPLLLTEFGSAELIDSVRDGEVRILEESLGVRFPIVVREAGGDAVWESQTDGQFESMIEGDGYALAQFKLPIQSQGGMIHLPIQRKSTLDLRVGVAAGHLPLPLLSLLIDKSLDAAQRKTFAADNHIVIQTPSRNLLAGALSSSSEPLIPRDATPLLEKGLKIRLFRPQELSNAKLRFALGLEESDAPVPDGVYLARDSLGLGGIYAVGDVEELAMAVEGSYQVLTFQLAAGTWTLKFSPSESRTQFISPEGVTDFDLLPLGIIMASGKINSLGGGAVDGSGKAVLVQDREISSVLEGVQLTIVASDRIDISSHLIAQGLQWRDGIPYLKKEQTQLIVYSAGREFQEDADTEGGIRVSEAAPKDIKIQASLTAQGLGFEIAGADKTAYLIGSLQAVDYISGGNQMNLYSYLNSADLRNGFSAVPQTMRPVLSFPLLEALDWREF